MIKKLVIGLAVVAMVFGASASMTNALTAADVTTLCAVLSCTPAQTTALMALVTPSTGGSMMSYTFNTNLTVGSRGADVNALQQILIDGGYLNIAAPTGYFGNATKAAVIAWQKASGISPAAGYVGPISRAALNSMKPATTPTTPTTPGTPTTPVGQGTEGSITTKLATTPVADQNIRRTADVPVYGIEVTSVGSDMSVDRFDMQVSVTPTGGSAQNPGSYVNTIKAWDGSTLLKSWTVGTADFVKDTSDRYHIILTGLGFKVPKGSIKNLTFSFSVASISSSDVNRTVAVQGYAGSSQNVRATDTLGLQSYTDMSGTANSRSHVFKPAGASTLTVSANSALTPKAGNTRVSSTNGITKKVLQGFDAKSESGNSKITKLYVALNATSTAGLPSVVYLCESSDTTCANPIGSATAPTTVGGQAGFTSLNIVVPQDTTKSFLIAADFPTTVGGQAASSSFVASSVQWEKPDGSTASTTPGSAFAGNDQYMYGAVPVFALNGTPTVSSAVTSGSASATTTLTFKMPIKVTGMGGPTVKPVLGDFVLKIASTTATSSGYHAGNSLVAGTAGGTTATLDQLSPILDTVGDGSSYTFTLSGTIDSRVAAGTFTANPGNYRMVLTAASSSVNWFGINQTWGLDDFQTPSAFLPN